MEVKDRFLEFFDKEIESIVRETSSDYAAIAVWNPERGDLHLYESQGFPASEPAPRLGKGPMGVCAEKGEPVSGYIEDFPYVPERLTRYIGSVLCRPLKLDLGLVGSVGVGRKRGKVPYSSDDENFLEEKAKLLSFAYNYMLFKEMERRKTELVETLIRLLSILRKEKLGEEELAKEVLEVTSDFFKAHTCIFSKVVSGKDELEIVAYKGDPPEGRFIRFGEGASGQAALKRRLVIFEDYPKDVLPSVCSGKCQLISSAVAIPIMVGNELYGTLSFCRSIYQRKFTAADLKVLETFTRVINFVFSIYRFVKEREVFNRIVARTQKMEALGILAGGIAHDFNNSLNIIMGYAQLCQEKAFYPEVKEFLSVIIDECKRAASLISQILAFSRESDFEKKVLDLKPLLKEFVKLIRRTLPENIHVEYQDDGKGSYHIMGTPEHIHVVLMNLVANSKDAMPEGGNLVLRLQKQGPHPAVEAASTILLEVEDTGEGIPEEYIDRVFEPFFTTKDPDKGTGFGLYQVYNIVKSMDGFVDIVSSRGKGTTVRIYLPEVKEDDVAGRILKLGEAAPVYPSISLEGKVLVVEDNGKLLDVLLHSLANLGLKADGFTDPHLALSHLKESTEDYCLLITDVVMPRLDGFAVADEVRKIKPNMKVIYITGYTNKASEILTRAQEKNTTVLLKPFSVFELAEAIKKLS